MDTLSVASSSVKAALGQHPALLTLAAIFLCHRLLHNLRRRRSRILPRTRERVLVIGASSGIGRAIAHEYAATGARVCVVGRREQQLNEVAAECASLHPTPTANGATGTSERILHVVADFNNVEDMVALREKLENEWAGLDTLIVSAGVSALRPLLEVAGLEQRGGAFYPPHAAAEGIKRTVSVATAAIQGNYLGPLVSAVTFIPLLCATSPAPSVALISSLAGVIPAPTRSIYASTKGAALLLYQSLAIEHPSVAFTYILPATVEGDFRASAVDGGTVREADPSKHGLKRVAVAKRCLRAIDHKEKAVFMPALISRVGHYLYWVFPSFVERAAAKKYNYTAN
ncbi:Dehydrogenase/reductase SDR family member 7B [Trametes pubescens]|uniref:Dehydrogenase/reductase SDR family member 7B n=1 Tax=Trametes pubescens TaxID=154538 RepID=A0A1M2VBD9_TRAPU|nr:Dehydrogenase/reductase SDR family member 7B [Trametes pubescens]